MPSHDGRKPRRKGKKKYSRSLRNLRKTKLRLYFILTEAEKKESEAAKGDLMQLTEIEQLRRSLRVAHKKIKKARKASKKNVKGSQLPTMMAKYVTTRILVLHGLT